MEHRDHGDATSSEALEEQLPVGVMEGNDAFDLAALCLSPLDSPAMTTAASASDGFSALSDGLSLATDDKDGDDSDAASDEEEGSSYQEKEAKGHDVHHRRRDDDYNASDTIRDHAMPGSIAQHSGDQDQDEAAADVVAPVPMLVLSASPGVPSSFAVSPRRDDDSDDMDDMTVECASPRDPRDLDDINDVIPEQQSRRGDAASDTAHQPPATAGDAEEQPPVTDINATPSAPAASQTLYSLKTIFPVVYEPPNQSTERVRSMLRKETIARSSERARRDAPPSPAGTLKTVKATKLSSTTTTSGDQRSQQQTDASRKGQVHGASKSLSLQLQVAETERKQLAQRNARLKSQLEALTADLVRAKADAAKWKTENDVYAAKMPRLQAELSDETSQLDEKHAQAIQSQLELTQLRAKAQVLQTRAGNLDAQVEKLQGELRVVKKELRRRVIVHQQADEKTKRLEQELHETKASHAHDLQLHKQKLAMTVQRLNHERVQIETELTKRHQQQLDEARAALAKATKKWKELEHTQTTREHELLVLKKRVDEWDDDARAHGRHTKTTETLLARAERTEVALRGQVSALKVQLQACERETHRAKLRASTMASGASRLRTRPTTSRPVVPLDPARSSVQSDTSSHLCSCCQMVLDSLAKADRLDDMDDGDLPERDDAHCRRDGPARSCARCAALEAELLGISEQLTEARTLHAHELKVQATAFERVVAAFRGTASPDAATMRCA